MDPTRFDRLTKSLSRTNTRRGLVRLVTALPLAGALGGLLGAEGADGQGNVAGVGGGGGRRHRRRARHHPGQGKDNRNGKRKHRKHPSPPPTPDPTPATCVAPDIRCPAGTPGAGTCGRLAGTGPCISTIKCCSWTCVGDTEDPTVGGCCPTCPEGCTCALISTGPDAGQLGCGSLAAASGLCSPDSCGVGVACSCGEGEECFNGVCTLPCTPVA